VSLRDGSKRPLDVTVQGSHDPDARQALQAGGMAIFCPNLIGFIGAITEIFDFPG
jgi:hypothetical protein